MRVFGLAAAALLVIPGTGWANSLTGVWTLPNGKKANVSRIKDGKSKVVTSVLVGKRAQRLVFVGDISYVKVGDEGGLGVAAAGASFPIVHNARRCLVKNPELRLMGDLVTSPKGREYRTSGWVTGYIHCGGDNTWTRWTANLTGTWNAKQ